MVIAPKVDIAGGGENCVIFEAMSMVSFCLSLGMWTMMEAGPSATKNREENSLVNLIENQSKNIQVFLLTM